MSIPDDVLDRRARQAHAASLDALSPRVLAQLAQRRHAALAAPRARVVPRWGWVGAAAAVGALAIALQLQTPQPPEASPLLASTATVPADPGSVLAEDPDFYLWLASGEAQALAME